MPRRGLAAQKSEINPSFTVLGQQNLLRNPVPVPLTRGTGQSGTGHCESHPKGEKSLEIHVFGERRHCRHHLSGSDCWNWCLKIIRSEGAFKNQMFLLTLSSLALCMDGLSSLGARPIQLQEKNGVKKNGENFQIPGGWMVWEIQR